MFKIRILYAMPAYVVLLQTCLQEWNNYVTNYKKELFGKGSQTWQINAFKRKLGLLCQ